MSDPPRDDEEADPSGRPPTGARDPARRPAPTSEMGEVLRRGIKSSLARWVIAKGRGHRASPPPSPQDEATHAWDGQPLFAEDYTFTGAQAGLGVVLRLEWIPGRDAQRVWVVLLRPDGAWSLGGGQAVLRTSGDDRWRAGGLQLDCVTPMRRWTLRFAGRLERGGHAASSPALRVVDEDEPHQVRGSVDLTFVAEAEPWSPGIDDDPELLARRLGEADWNATLLRGARRARTFGYVQVGRLHGTVALGDLIVPVRAWSLRQHTWGVRDWGASPRAYQCFVATEDERRAWVHHTRFSFATFEGGFMAHRDRAVPIRHLGLSAEQRPHRPPARVGLALGEIGGAHQVQAELESELSFVVDGQAHLDLGLLRVTSPSPGWGVWAGLRREPPPR